jgi:hypothetical protein
MIIKNLTNQTKSRTIRFTLFAFIISIAIINIGCSEQVASDNQFEMQMTLIEVGNQDINNLDWDGYAAILDQDGLERFKNSIMPGIEKLILASPSDSINLFGMNFNSEEIQSKNATEFFTTIMNMASEISIDLKNTFTGMKNDNIGAISEGDSLVHVLVRTELSVGGQTINEMNVNTVQKLDGEWKILMSPKIEGIAMMIRRGLPQ